MSRLTWAGLFAGLFLIQSAVLPFLFSGRWMPDLWFCAIIISVLAFNRKTALAFAVAGGIAQDIVTGNLFGLHLFPYLALALLTAAFMRERYNRRWLVSVASVAVGTAVYLLFVCAVTALSGGRISFLRYLLYSGIPQILANTAAAAVMHPVLWDMKQEWKPRW